MITLRQRDVALSRKSFVAMGLFMLLYLAAAAACLIQWGSENPWSRLDRFSITYLLLGAVLGLEQTVFALRLQASPALLNEVFGTGYDPRMALWTGLLAIGELAAFIDYGHVHLLPQLERPPLQAAGLILCLLAVAWLVWVDKYLRRHFASGLEARQLMMKGPYRYLRHPRYLGLMASRIGFSLALASGVAWVLVFGWFLAVRRRIRLEEAHLGSVFGPEYSAYSNRTARLIPRVY